MMTIYLYILDYHQIFKLSGTSSSLRCTCKTTATVRDPSSTLFHLWQVGAESEIEALVYNENICKKLEKAVTEGRQLVLQ